eukprot:COSAG05_NODE_292_length_12012_cov_12.968354_7_plen_155_part_00
MAILVGSTQIFFDCSDREGYYQRATERPPAEEPPFPVLHSSLAAAQQQQKQRQQQQQPWRGWVGQREVATVVYGRLRAADGSEYALTQQTVLLGRTPDSGRVEVDCCVGTAASKSVSRQHVVLACTGGEDGRGPGRCAPAAIHSMQTRARICVY